MALYGAKATSPVNLSTLCLSVRLQVPHLPAIWSSSGWAEVSEWHADSLRRFLVTEVKIDDRHLVVSPHSDISVRQMVQINDGETERTGDRKKKHSS